jgi:hypothetical protein
MIERRLSSRSCVACDHPGRRAGGSGGQGDAHLLRLPGGALSAGSHQQERILREIRRRTRVVGAFPDGQSALNLAAARLRHIAGTAWLTKRYLNIELLKDQEMRNTHPRMSQGRAPLSQPKVRKIRTLDNLYERLTVSRDAFLRAARIVVTCLLIGPGKCRNTRLIHARTKLWLFWLFAAKKNRSFSNSLSSCSERTISYGCRRGK